MGWAVRDVRDDGTPPDVDPFNPEGGAVDVVEIEEPRWYEEWPEGLPDDGIDTLCQMVPCAGEVVHGTGTRAASIAVVTGDAEVHTWWYGVWRVTDGTSVAHVCEDCKANVEHPEEWDGTPEAGRPEFIDGTLRWVPWAEIVRKVWVQITAARADDLLTESPDFVRATLVLAWRAAGFKQAFPWPGWGPEVDALRWSVISQG